MSLITTQKCLHYASPAHGGWGVVRMAMLVPESYQLFVCPFACGRHGAIGAREQGLKDRLSYLYLSQSDIIEGYEDLIINSIDEYLETLGVKPRVVFVFVSCLDDLIGTDTIALRDKLNKTYPQIEFQIGHMNPISLDSKTPPPVTTQRIMWELLKERKEKTKTINILGALEYFGDDNDIVVLLKKAGYEIKHISNCKTYDEFLELASCCLNIVFSPMGLMSAIDLKERLNIPYIQLLTSYDDSVIVEQYKTLEECLKIKFDWNLLDEYRSKALQALEKAKTIIDSMPLVLSSSSTVMTFELAKYLIKHKFKLESIFVQKPVKYDKENYQYIVDNYPNISIYQILHHTMINDDYTSVETLSLGIEASYITKSKYPVDITADLKMFGFMGLTSLANKMIEAYQNPRSIKELLDEYKLVI